MNKEFDLKIEGATLENIKVDSLNSLIVATYKRDAEEFKAGDILIDAYDKYKPLKYISIFKEKSKNRDGGFLAFIVFEIYSGKFRYPSGDWDGIKNNRLATEEEKQLLFDALKKDGKRWNAERLKIEPEFKRGDILISKLGESTLIFDKYTSRQSFSSLISNHAKLSNDNWHASAFRYASIEEIEVFYKYLARMGKKWNTEKLEIEELDISDIVVDYESAIKYLGIKDTLLVPLLCSLQSQDRADKFNAQIKLQIIAEAWNKFDEFEADWESLDQYKHFPLFKVEDGKIALLCVSFVIRSLNPHTPNFSFKTEERAIQFGNQFIDLFKVALGF